jgi:uncharacterized protein (TIGR02118 family)
MTDNEATTRRVVLIARKPGMSFAEFDDYWRDVHGPLAAQVPGLVSYTQHHIVPPEGATEPDNGFGIDGIAILEFESDESMQAGWASEAGQATLADGAKFIGQEYRVNFEDYQVKINGS